ncbi:hypothetical protein BJF88_03555 [Cellulosimicrobium sp. CUA-896]|nr:hypothetical protein BJF88_03555 [Cellulosimicrobium sp. CUA-896]
MRGRVVEEERGVDRRSGDLREPVRLAVGRVDAVHEARRVEARGVEDPAAVEVDGGGTGRQPQERVLRDGDTVLVEVDVLAGRDGGGRRRRQAEGGDEHEPGQGPEAPRRCCADHTAHRKGSRATRRRARFAQGDIADHRMPCTRRARVPIMALALSVRE